ncbi:MAG TPA: hypothetical protein VLL05_16590, partial [Terriglobales bacterium]|nr:hypothetical protein [Terriglobales bacterium]
SGLQAGGPSSWVENLDKFISALGNAGSFDCVRLTPHFAQDGQGGFSAEDRWCWGLIVQKIDGSED